MPFRIRAALVLATALAAASPGAAAVTKEIQVRGDRVTAKLEQAPVADVVADIARASGAELRGDVLAPRDVTTQFEQVPVKEALERLLDGQNFTLTYADDGHLKAIELKAMREEKVRRPAAQAQDDGGEPAYQRAAFRAFAGRDRVPVDGDLAKRFGNDRVNWDLLANTAYGDRDAATRRAAVRAAMRAIEKDPALRAAIEDATRGVSDAELATFARERCYNRADELVRNILLESDLPEFRDRARGVLHELKKQPFRGQIPWEFAKPADG